MMYATYTKAKNVDASFSYLRVTLQFLNKKVRSWKPMNSMDLDIVIFMKNLLMRKNINIKDVGLLSLS